MENFEYFKNSLVGLKGMFKGNIFHGIYYHSTELFDVFSNSDSSMFFEIESQLTKTVNMQRNVYLL